MTTAYTPPFTMTDEITNLVIEIEVVERLSFSGFGNRNWYGESTTGNNAYCNDVGYNGIVGVQSFLPKTTFTYESAGVSVDPTSLSFGGDSFYFGNTEEKNVTVSNSTTSAAAVSIDGDIDIKSDRHIVDAKSIMGIFSLDLTKPLTLVVADDNTDISSLKEFFVEEN